MPLHSTGCLRQKCGSSVHHWGYECGEGPPVLLCPWCPLGHGLVTGCLGGFPHGNLRLHHSLWPALGFRTIPVCYQPEFPPVSACLPFWLASDPETLPFPNLASCPKFLLGVTSPRRSSFCGAGRTCSYDAHRQSVHRMVHLLNGSFAECISFRYLKLTDLPVVFIKAC